jgi:hypothetical protein
MNGKKPMCIRKPRKGVGCVKGRGRKKIEKIIELP